MICARRDRGFVLITIVATIAVVLTLIGLAIDTGNLQLAKIRMQTAADAAALGAVQELRAGGTGGLAAAARDDAAANGYIDGQSSVEVSVHNPPASGYYTADTSAVEVIIRKDVKTFFMSLIGFHTMNVTARSVARRGPGTNCVYVLDPSASGALSASGNAIAQVRCGVVVNSTSNSALSVSGNARLTATAIQVAGGYSTSANAYVSPAPVVHSPAEPDPLSQVPAPAVGACSQTGFSLSGSQSRTITEGVYCNGISVSAGAHLTLSPGTYILKGGGVSISGYSTVTGTGVTFYNTAGGGFAYSPVSMSGQAAIQLSAPASGPRAGILFFQDRSISSGAANSIAGGSTSYFNGALYFPTTALSYSGGSAGRYTIVVAKTLNFSGGTTLNNDYSTLPDGPPVKGSAALGE
jgi:Flp pilus assembly protein TadG